MKQRENRNRIKTRVVSFLATGYMGAMVVIFTLLIIFGILLNREISERDKESHYNRETMINQHMLIDSLKKEVEQSNAERDAAVETLERMPLGKPLKKIKKVSGYGWRGNPVDPERKPRFHFGVDYNGKSGDTIYATATGTINHVGWKGGYGNTVTIEHTHGLQTLYAHMGRVLVDNKQHVKRGQPIGLVGATGQVTGAHLHYEVWEGTNKVNPSKFNQTF